MTTTTNLCFIAAFYSFFMINMPDLVKKIAGFIDVIENVKCLCSVFMFLHLMECYLTSKVNTVSKLTR